MKNTRRDFIKQASIAAAALAVPQRGVLLAAPSPIDQQRIDPFFRDVCVLALDAARSNNAAYADVRIVRRHTQEISAVNNRLDELNEAETLGIGVRALVDGAWGFSATKNVSRQDCRRIAEDAVQQARVNSRLRRRSIELAPVAAYPDGVWRSPIRRDPFDVPANDKGELLLNANDAALSVSSTRSARSFLSFVREEKTFASTEGSIIAQTVYRSWPSLTVEAASSDSVDTVTRTTHDIPPMGLGYEHVLSANLGERALEVAEDAAQALSARSVEPGTYDLILDPTNLATVLHETLGRATELDRALGYLPEEEVSTLLSSPGQVVGNLQLGPEFMNILCDRTQRGGLATIGWDDEGVPQDSWPIVRDGIFVDYQTTRELVAQVADVTGTEYSHGCATAESWDTVQLQRMPNVSLMPGEGDYDIYDLIAATDRGIYVKGPGFGTFDHARNSFEFGGQAFYEVRGGRIVGRLRDVAYRSSTLDFWNSLDLLGGPSTYLLAGVVGNKKGRPPQDHAVSHGCPAARFRQRTVVNTSS